METSSFTMASNPFEKPNKDRLGFLDLPPEIRLQIYPYLLITFKTQWSLRRNSSSGMLERIQLPPKLVANLTITSAEDEVHPSSVHRRIYKFEEFDEVEEPLAPEILSACHTISSEATPILYRENKFGFSADYHGVDFPTTSAILKRDVEHLMSYSAEDWEEHSVPVSIKGSTVAAFIRKIGSYKSSLIRSVKLRSMDTDEATNDILLATQLAAYHLPGLESMRLLISKKDICWNESPEYWHPDCTSPFWTNGGFAPMFKALNEFVSRIHWLRQFEYDDYGQPDFDDHRGNWKLGELEKLVERRTQKRKAKANRLLKEQKQVAEEQ